MKNRIEELKQKIREATGENPIFGKIHECPPELEEAFLEHVLAFETAPERTLFDVLGDLGIELPRPKKLTDRELTAKLWEVIRSLLKQSIVLCNTDHLTDRELYDLLWNDTLRKEFVISSHFTLHIDMTETGVEDGMPTYLTYYASEAQRQEYLEAYPDFKMPRHVEPPLRRDHLIPDVPPMSSKRH